MKKIILLIICLLLSGCYDYQELNDMSIVSGIGISYEDDEYVVSLEITESVKSSNDSSISTKIVKGQDKSIANAFSKAMKNSNKQVYMELVKVLVLSEDVAKEGILPVIDYIIMSTNINSNYRMVVTKDIDELFELELDNESVSNIIVETINYGLNSKNSDNLDIKASYLMTNSRSIALPYVDIDEENIIIDKTAIFKEDKLWEIKDDKLYQFLILNSENINFEKDSNVISIYKNEIKYDVMNGKVIIKINGYGKVTQVNDDIDLENEKVYPTLEDMINEEIDNEVTKYLDDTMKEDIDILGLKDLYYKKTKKKIENIKYEIDVNVNINKNGSLYGALYE